MSWRNWRKPRCPLSLAKKKSTENETTRTLLSNSATILVAEDSAIYRHLIEAHLAEWGFTFTSVRDGKEAWEVLTQKGAPKLALLDWVLPEIDGVEVCRRLRCRSGDEPYTYTILLSAKNHKHEMLEAMAAGVDDFLAKPFDPLELKARLLVGKRIVDLQQKLVSAKDALYFAAKYDFLTGVWNRSEIVAFMERELARAQRDATPVGIVLFDVDHFKRVNDEFGHETGDHVLREITKRLSSSLREYDGIGRYGGEEFLIVIPGCDLATTCRRANQIRELIANKPVITPLGAIDVTISIGAAVVDAAPNVELPLRRADAALYEAKRNGRNRVEPAISVLAEVV
ncbi:MAG: diguanylate cyclase [Candidatus Sulfotelmatobacter sp.]